MPYSEKLCQGLLAGRCVQKHRQELTRLRSHKGCGKRWMEEVFWPPVLLSSGEAGSQHVYTSSRRALGTEGADSVGRTKIKPAISLLSRGGNQREIISS